MKLPTARVFLREAAGRYVALDGRMWRTLAALLFRPGFLTREYYRGRRRRYIRPARLFLVLSLGLFAAIRFFASAPDLIDLEPTDAPAGAAPAKQGARSASKSVAKTSESDSGEIQMPGFTIHVDPEFNLDVGDATSPFAQELKRRFKHFNGLSRQEKSEQVFLGAVRYGPYAMFVLMPAYALLLLVAYLGRGRRYPDRPQRYAEHLVFAAHTHAFLFLIGVLALAIPVTAVRAALGFWWLLYVLWATKVVYRGSWIGLVSRAFLVSIFYLVLFALAMAGLLLVAILIR
ncbi:MAG TPA: DUF3667 domain-containing protein [Casimicrobiaceae bacterium]|nr:DUF3667 domain-containing protein [Casimicrobiaceae bacterium]